MNDLPLYLVVLGLVLSALVFVLGFLFLFKPELGLAFATHRLENLPTVMVNLYFTMAILMAGSIFYGEPEVIAFVFAVTGLAPAHDAWIYARAGQPFIKHVYPAVLSAIMAIGALIVYQTGAV